MPLSLKHNNLKVSKTVKFHLDTGLLNNCKLYPHRGHYANHVLKWLLNNGACILAYKNDAPRNGKKGNYVSFKLSPDLIQFKIEYEYLKKNEQKKQQAIQQKIIADAQNLSVSPSEKLKFIQTTINLSNRKKRKIASGFVAKKIGYHSHLATKRFLELINQPI